MKARLLLFLWCIVAVAGCTKDDTIMLLSMQEQDKNSGTRFERNPIDLYKFTDSTIILGAKLENPYSVVNLQIARDSLISAGMAPMDVPVVLPTHYYARFKPADDDALAELMERDTTIIYYEFPLDYEIKEYGVSYHDPSIADTLPTYQYASVPIAQWQNLQDIPNVECTMLEALCILDEDKDGSHLGPITPIDPDPFLPDPRDTLPFKPVIPPGDDKIESIGNVYLSDTADDTDTNGYDESAISALMSKSFELTGNGDYEEPSMTRASSKWQPAGRIRAYDNIVDDYIPLQGVRVRARRWFTTHKGETDSKGYYKCNGTFKNPANYSIVWDTKKYNIRDGNIVQAYYNGPKRSGDWNLDIKDGKSVRYATIHRAAYRMFFGDINTLYRPIISRKINLAYLHKKGNHINGDYNQLWGLGIWSDIRIYGKNEEEGWRALSGIFSTTCHELGHAAHHTNTSKKFKNSTTAHIESWARFVEYIITKLEYENLGVYEVYSPYIAGTEYHVPDTNHNRQKWDKLLYNHVYTPIYIDLYDDFNQQEYFKKKHYSNYLDYPNDDIHIYDIQKIQNLVFESTSFTEIKDKLLNYKQNFSIKDCREFNITEENINKLFSCYE